METPATAPAPAPALARTTSSRSSSGSGGGIARGDVVIASPSGARFAFVDDAASSDGGDDSDSGAVVVDSRPGSPLVQAVSAMSDSTAPMQPVTLHPAAILLEANDDAEDDEFEALPERKGKRRRVEDEVGEENDANV
ncbi:hypothetical protein HK405_012728, partial [Cladochytrium tenue]